MKEEIGTELNNKAHYESQPNLYENYCIKFLKLEQNNLFLLIFLIILSEKLKKKNFSSSQ